MVVEKLVACNHASTSKHHVDASVQMKFFSLQAINTPHFIVNHVAILFNISTKKTVDNFRSALL